MADWMPPLRRRTFLKGMGLGIAAAPGFSLLSSCSNLLGKQPVIDLKGSRKVLSVDALEAAPDGFKRQIYAYGGQLIGPTIRVKEGERLIHQDPQQPEGSNHRALARHASTRYLEDGWRGRSVWPGHPAR